MSIVNDNMSDTPETDAAWKEGNAIREWTCCKLERERNEARESLDEEMKFHHRTHTELIHTQCKILDMQMCLDEARENCKSIVDKANELIARWDEPSWKDTAPTARYINALRIAVRAYERQKP
jgi:hypothetical protein